MSIDEAIMHEMQRLQPDQKVRLLDYARSLEGAAILATTRAPGKQLIEQVGQISPEDAAEMLKIIDQDCERTDPDA